jgi:hypothetical protein
MNGLSRMTDSSEAAKKEERQVFWKAHLCRQSSGHIVLYKQKSAAMGKGPMVRCANALRGNSNSCRARQMGKAS